MPMHNDDGELLNTEDLEDYAIVRRPRSVIDPTRKVDKPKPAPQPVRHEPRYEHSASAVTTLLLGGAITRDEAVRLFLAEKPEQEPGGSAA